MKVLKLGLLLTVLLPLPASAKDPAMLPASSDWLLDYADERCTLVRDFGSGNQALQLRIESFGSWRTFRFTLLGTGVPRTGRATGQMKIQFLQDSPVHELGALHGTVNDTTRAVSFSASFAPPEPIRARPTREQAIVYQATPKPVDTSYEQGISSFAITFSNGKKLALDTGAMVAPLEAMRACVDDLQRSWGLDPAVQRGLSRMPVVRIETVRDVQRNYPTEMLAAMKTAFVPVRVMITQEGVATDCVVQSGSVAEAFAAAVCDGLMGRYDPALDQAGNPVGTAYLTSIVYLMGR